MEENNQHRKHGPRLPTKEEVLATAGEALARGIARTLSMDPHEAALAAYRNGGPSVEELEARILELHAAVGTQPPEAK